jgi:hypothetical protein
MREKIIKEATDGLLDVTQPELHNRLPEKRREENNSPVLEEKGAVNSSINHNE